MPAVGRDRRAGANQGSGGARLAAVSMAEETTRGSLPAARQDYDRFVRLQQPSRRIRVEIVVPSGAVTTGPVAAQEPAREPQPQP